ncbi:MAG: NB-ARC domain-containing protein [Aggregatilineales bacterium]
MPLQNQTFNELVHVFTPYFETVESRQTLIGSAFFGTPILYDIQLEGNPRDFTVRTLETLADAKPLTDGTPPSVQLMQVLASTVGTDKQSEMASLIDKVREEVATQIDTPDDTDSVPLMMPPLPDDFVPRPIETDLLMDSLLNPQAETVAITAALKGAGGYGKTTLASAICHDEQIRRKFCDGILWVELGESVTESELISKVLDLCVLFDADSKRPTVDGLNSARVALQQAIGDKAILLVVDDLWLQSHARPFLDIGKNTTTLITTRNSNTLENNAIQHDVDAMQPDEAIRLLGYGLEIDDDMAMQALAKRLGYWALLLKLANGQLRAYANFGMAIAELLPMVGQMLDEQGFDAFDNPDDPDSRNSAAAMSIGVSVGLLRPHQQAAFAKLAIFPEDTDIPLSTLLRVWDCNLLTGLQIARRLMELSLLLRFDAGRKVIRLHDVIRTHLRFRHQSDLTDWNAQLITKYDDLTALPDDYAWEFVAYHLMEAEQRETLRDLLLNVDFLYAKLHALRDPQTLIEDCDLHGTDDATIKLLQSAFNVSSYILRDYPDQLLSQLYGRLLSHRETNPEIDTLLQTIADHEQYPAFLTTQQTLDPAGGALIRTFAGHTSNVYAVAFSPDGQTALSGSDDKTLRLWEVGAGSELRRFEGHTDQVTAVAFSPDGQTILSGSSDKTLRLWDVGSGTELRRFEGHGVTAVAFSPDGQTVLSGFYDETLRLWDVEMGSELRRFEGHTDPVTTVAFSPDGQTALSGSESLFSSDNTVRLWDVETGAELRRFEGHTSDVNAVAFSPDGQTVLSGSSDKTLRLWDVQTGAELRRFEGHTSFVTAVAFSPNGQIVLSGSNSFGSSDNTVRLWDVHTGAELRRFEGHTSSVTAVAFSPNGQTILSGSADKTLRLWDVATAGELRRFEGHTGKVKAVAASPDGQTALSASDDKTLRLWNMQSGTERQRSKWHEHVNAVAFSPDCRIALFSYRSMALYLWEIKTGEVLRRFTGHTGGVTALAVSPDGQTALSGNNGKTLHLWNINTGGELRHFEGHTDTVTAVVFSPDGHSALSGSMDNTLRLWDIASGQTLRTFEGHSSAVTAVAFSPDDHSALSGSHDKTLRLWDIATGNEYQQWDDTPEARAAIWQQHGVTLDAVSPDRQWLLTRKGTQLQLWRRGSDMAVFRFIADAFIEVGDIGAGLRVVAADEGYNVHILHPNAALVRLLS